jgi:nucleotide-binding universal stress UspA family protein
MKLETELVRVNDSPADAYPAVDAIYLDAVNRHREAARREAEHYLREKAQVLRAEGLDRVTSRAVEGNPGEEIIELARNTPYNLVAMSTHGRSGVDRWVLGSIAEKVIQHSQDPVLIVRPGASRT